MEERYFRTVYLDEARTFLLGLNPGVQELLLEKIHQAEENKDPKFFKKLNDQIWEFRCRRGFMRIRMLAFWDKTDKADTLVVATHGFYKKTDRVPGNEIIRAMNLRKKYFETKS